MKKETRGVHVCWETLSRVQGSPVRSPDTVREKERPPAGPVSLLHRRSESADVQLGEEQQAVHQQPEQQDEVHHVRLLDELGQGVAVRALALLPRGFATVVGLPAGGRHRLLHVEPQGSGPHRPPCSHLATQLESCGQPREVPKSPPSEHVDPRRALGARRPQHGEGGAVSPLHRWAD